MTVVRLIAGRILGAALTLLLVSMIVFVMIEVLPGDVASRILGQYFTQESYDNLRRQLNLDAAASARYLAWLVGLLHGDFGVSLISGKPVAQVLWQPILNTLILSALALAIYLPLAVIPASIQALNRDRAIDHGISVVTLVVLSTPDFLLGTLLLVTFVVLIPVLPAVSVVEDTTTFLGWGRALVLPALTLAITMAVYAGRMLRDNLIEVLDAEYVRMAELKGLPKRKVLLGHALPNALIPTLNVTALNLAYLAGGVMIVEKVYSFPGFGSLLISSLQLLDVPLVEATVLIAAMVYIGANLVADIGAILLNPRLRGG